MVAPIFTHPKNLRSTIKKFILWHSLVTDGAHFENALSTHEANRLLQAANQSSKMDGKMILFGEVRLEEVFEVILMADRQHGRDVETLDEWKQQ